MTAATALPDLTPKAFEAFMERLHSDANLLAEVVRGIDQHGFLAVLEQHFQLSKEQQAQLEPLRAGRGGARHWEQMFTMCLISGGDITIVHEGRDSFDLELHAHIPGTEIGIDLSIHC